MTDHGPISEYKYEQSNNNTEPRQQTMHVDIGFFNNNMFLVTVVKPLNLVMSTYIDDKSTNTLIEALNNQVEILGTYKYRVISIISDNEANFRKILYVNGIKMKYTTSKDGTVERAIRTLKNRVRALLAGLPFNANNMFIREAVKYTTKCINMLPRTSGINNVPAREVVTGIKLNHKDLKIGFGDYAQVYKKGIKKNSILEEHSVGCISLGPTFNGYGGIRFYNPMTKSEIQSNNYKILPHTQQIIDLLNELSTNENCDKDIESENMITKQNEHTQSIISEIKNNEDNISYNNNIQSLLKPIISDIDINNNKVNNDNDINNNNIDNDNDNDNDTKSLQNIPIVKNDENSDNFDDINEEIVLQMTVKEALSKDYEFTTQALETEVKQLVNKNVFIPVHYRDIPLIHTSNILPCIIRVKEKLDENGEIIKYKGRICAGGHKMDKSLFGM
jgi:hypothetical protein